MRSRILVMTLGTLALSGSVHSQAPRPPLTSFEVVSIKRVVDGFVIGLGATRVGWDPGGRYRVDQGSVAVILRGAYPGMTAIEGLPQWVETEQYDVQANAERDPSADERAVLLRRLLADRFNVSAHVEQRDQPIYQMKLARSGVLGPRLKPTPIPCVAFDKLPPDERAAISQPSNGAPRCGTLIGPAQVLSGGMTMALLARNLRGQAGRLVTDETGLEGDYEVMLETSSEVSIFTALREQLGLTLEPSRAPLPVLVVDRIARPTPD